MTAVLWISVACAASGALLWAVIRLEDHLDSPAPHRPRKRDDEIVLGWGYLTVPLAPPRGGERAPALLNAEPAHPAGDPWNPPAAGTAADAPQFCASHTPAAGDPPMPDPSRPETPAWWRTELIPPAEQEAAKTAAALDYMPRAPLALWESDTFVTGLDAIRDGA
jgi:hypothetical protein